MKNLKSNKNKVMIILVVIITSFIMFFFSITSKHNYVSHVSVSPLDVSEAVQSYQDFTHVLFYSDNDIEYELKKDTFSSILKSVSHLAPLVNLQAIFLEESIQVYASLDLTPLISNTYINVICSIKQNNQNLFEDCQLGNIPIHGLIIKYFIDFILYIHFDPSIRVLVDQLITSLEIRSDSIYIAAPKYVNLKQDLLDGIHNTINFAYLFKDKNQERFEQEIIESYLLHFMHSPIIRNANSLSLSEIFNVAFAKASNRSQWGNAAKENEYALWAIAIAFVNTKFAEVLNVDLRHKIQEITYLSEKELHLNNRYDLVLHFIYSAIIERIGNQKISINVGELKELFDANKQGSGFDISDLAADIAGVKFANFISTDHDNAIYAQQFLSKNLLESNFFPQNNLYTKNYKFDDFIQHIGSTQSAEYKKIIDKIHSDIARLKLYQKPKNLTHTQF